MNRPFKPNSLQKLSHAKHKELYELYSENKTFNVVH